MLRKLFLPLRAKIANSFSECAAPRMSASPVAIGVRLTPAPITLGFHTSSVAQLGRKLRKATGSTFEQKKLTAPGEDSEILASRSSKFEDRFPDMNLPTRLFNGIMFKDLPILNVKASLNNTIFTLADSKGNVELCRSCGCDGFKNARKGTNVAAQATGFVLGKKMVNRGFKTVRARVQGLGAGRLASLKGVSIAGVEIVSITDSTPVSWNPPRARKQRRV